MNHSSKLSAVIVSALTVMGSASIANAQQLPGHRRHRDVGAEGSVAAPATQSLDGRLGRRDPTDADGRHMRTRTLRLRRGDTVEYALTSDDMDVLARVEGPTGQTWENDDSNGGTDSLLRFTAPADGVYRFVATTYEAGATGSFHVNVTINDPSYAGDSDGDHADDHADDNADDSGDDANDDGDSGDDSAANNVPQGNAAAAATGAGGRTFGVFVGITDNGGENDLPGSADDAVQLAHAFESAGWMQRSNGIVLTDREATPANIRAAFARLAPRVTAGDTFVFFYDGHGDVSELGTRNGSLSRAELDGLLSRVGGREIVVLDSCHAGGFQSIIRGHENRYGLFSSRANELSSTAPSVNAGGWLAYFFRQAVAGSVRRNADGSADYASLVRYVQNQYDQRNISREQHLVSVSGGASQTFALGGPNAGTSIDNNGTAVATRIPSVPVQPAEPTVATAPQMPSWGSLPSLPALGSTRMPSINRQQVAQLTGLGMAVANSVITSLVK